MPSICTQWATVGLHLTVPGMRVLKLNDSLNNCGVGANRVKYNNQPAPNQGRAGEMF